MSWKMPVTLLSLAVAAALGTTPGCSRPDDPPPPSLRVGEQHTLVLRNGKIITMNEAQPEAEALAVRGERIVAIGSNADVEAYIDERATVIDLGNRVAIPGFIEGHGHLMGIGSAIRGLRLETARNWDEIVQMVADAVAEAEPGEWIVGRGWHQDKWDPRPTPNVKGYPVHATLSAVSPENPVLLRHASGHGSFVNAKAMELAGITRDTPDPPRGSGEIVRDSDGNATGWLAEVAQRLVTTVYDEAQAQRSAADREADARLELELAMEEVLSKGVTSFQDAGSSYSVIDRFKTYADQGRLALRLWVMIRDEDETRLPRLASFAENLPRYRMVNYGDHYLTVRGIKVTSDGALGSHGAWLLEPYTDRPETVGLPTVPPDQLREVAKLAIEHGYQFGVHAIGDRANREVLNVFEETFREHTDKTDLRWRIEHAQHLHPEDIPRFAELGVIASMQANHCTSDGPWVPERLGPRRSREGAYVWRSLIDSGAVVTNGTDAPVEDVDPIVSFYAAATRIMDDGRAFYPEQRMTRDEALRSYTLWCAQAAFEENDKGSLEVGKLGDITILSQDLLTVPDEEILNTVVTHTIVGGRVAYERSPGQARSLETLAAERRARLALARLLPARGACCIVQ